MESELVAGRGFGEVYRVVGRRDLHEFLTQAVEASGGRLLYVSPPDRAPVFLGVQLDSDERLGLLVYPFRITRVATRNRPADEVRGQLRYGAEESWLRDHPVGRDVAGIDITMILGVDLESGVFVGLDSNLWDPLPMGISFYAKEAELNDARFFGWNVWEKVNKGGTKRSAPRSPTNLETIVAFTPDRLLEYARLERRATSLKLDPPLRFAAAMAMAHKPLEEVPPPRHVLEKQFNLTSAEILDIIGGRSRLAVAVRGGVAEHHLERVLRADPRVAAVERLDVDAMHDFNVWLTDGRQLRIECKNASPKLTADGSFRVEVQKTRSSKNDPASRFYAVDAFDVVAACLFSPTGSWSFQYCLTHDMARHKAFPDRLAPVQVLGDTWTEHLSDLPVSK